MADEIPNLWPDEIAIPDLRAPVQILRLQAASLHVRTKGLVEAEVASYAMDSNLYHDFVLVVPTLSGYRYTLFTVMNGTNLYPCEISTGAEKFNGSCQTEVEFMEKLRVFFASDHTKRIVSSLMAQAVTEPELFFRHT